MSWGSVLVLCLMTLLVSAQTCDWDLTTDPNQGLAPESLAAGARYLGQNQEVSDAESCKAACCEEELCELALLGRPADGGLQCRLVSCGDAGGCRLQHSDQFQVYRRSNGAQAEQEAPAGGQRLQVVPLLEAGEPRSNESSRDLCRLPMKTGPCRAAFPRFFYNVTSQSCDAFIFGGCEANSNNFESQDDCEASCSGVTGSVLLDDPTPAPPPPAPKAPRMAPVESVLEQDNEMPADEFSELCEVKAETGPCRAALPRWFYNAETGACQKFIYGGCRGNKNNYLSNESCKSTCAGVSVLPSSKKNPEDDERPADATDRCSLSPESGMCRAAFPKFYYDPDSASCQSFIYGGCGGNGNNFDSLEDCMTACSETGGYERHGKAESRRTSAFFLFVTLAAICALLLATLVIMTLRRRRITRSYSTVSDKQELIPDELSSQDSMSIPGSPTPEPKA